MIRDTTVTIILTLLVKLITKNSKMSIPTTPTLISDRYIDDALKLFNSKSSVDFENIHRLLGPPEARATFSLLGPIVKADVSTQIEDLLSLSLSSGSASLSPSLSMNSQVSSSNNDYSALI